MRRVKRTRHRAGLSRSSLVITEAVVTAVAAHAASTVAGVVRLQPGLLGLVGSVSRSARQHSKGRTGPDRRGAGDVRASPVRRRIGGSGWRWMW